MSVYEQLVGQAGAIAEIQRAAEAARAGSETSKNTGSTSGNTLGNGPGGTRSGPGSMSSTAAMTHAWLFTGPPGSGRSLAARVFAATLQCTGSMPGCGECAACKAVMRDNHPDVSWVRTDLVTIKADDVRSYVARSYVAPEQGKYRIFIVEDADRMLARTSNVLLKAIEEPAPRTVWMLCTAAVADVLPTIRSRTRNINLVTPSPNDVAQLLIQRDGVDPQRALVAAQAAQSHIGVARALATDPAANALRRTTLTALTQIRGVGDAALAAHMFVNPDLMHIAPDEDASSEYAGSSHAATGVYKRTSGLVSQAPSAADAIEVERARAMEALGLDSTVKLPAAVKSQIKEDAENLKRRQTRMQRDMLDRELIYIESFYRDVLIVQLSADTALINPDFSHEIKSVAERISPHQTIALMDGFVQARRRLRANVTPTLALEAALMNVAL